MEEETLKLLGKLEGHTVRPLAARMSASCNRVAVVDGHTVSLSIKLRKPATHEQILAAWAEFHPLAGLHLPTAPAQPVEWAPQTIARSRASIAIAATAWRSQWDACALRRA